MSFSAAGMNCIAVGPQKLYIYTTTDTMTTSVAMKLDEFTTDSCPGMIAGDIVIMAHNTAAKLGLIRITAIDAASVTYVEIAALA